MTEWCPKCKYKIVRGFSISCGNRCPQCGTAVGADEILREDPFARTETKQTLNNITAKKFQFDQKAGSDTDTTPGSLPSIPTESLGLYDVGKK